jgi:hypothetical protein
MNNYKRGKLYHSPPRLCTRKVAAVDGGRDWRGERQCGFTVIEKSNTDVAFPIDQNVNKPHV